MKNKLLLAIVCSSLCHCAMSFAQPAAEIITLQNKDSDTFVADSVNIGKVFDAVSERISKPVILSKAASMKRVTGNFNLAHPDEMLRSLTKRMALIWYDDGGSIYVYDNSESKSAIINTGLATNQQVYNYIRANNIYDPRFAVRIEGNKHLLYVSGPPIYLDIISAASKFLDEQARQLDMSVSEVAVIPLRNSSVSDRIYTARGQNVTIPGMLTALNTLFKAGNGNVESRLKIQPKPAADGKTLIEPGFPLPPDTSSLRFAEASANSSFALMAYPDSNSLVVKGSQEQIRYVRQLVDTLDESRRQIELSLWIIDISQSKIDDLGLRWEVGNYHVGGGTITFNRSTLADSRNFLVKVDAISQKGEAHIVSRPIILTQENIPALFDNNSSFYARVHGERVAELQQITYGTMISVLPRLSSGQRVEMEVNIEDGGLNRDNSGKVQDVDGLPEVNRTNINTVARIGKDSSLLIGGYTREQYTNTNSGIPFLSDIPVLGNLFKYRSTNQQKMVRIFLIQPRVLDENEYWDGRQFSPTERILQKNNQLQGTVQFLKKYTGKSWQ